MKVKNLILIMLLVILIGLIGIGSFYFGFKAKSLLSVPVPTPVPTITAQPTQIIVGGDKDSHGCIGSAGYSWCEPKQKCLRPFEEPCLETTVIPTTSVQAPTINETDLLKTAIKQALVAEHGSTANDLTITVSKIEGSFAQGGASASGGGGMWLAAKVSGIWKLLWDGNGTISCQAIDPYNYPASLAPECYNETTEKIITR